MQITIKGQMEATCNVHRRLSHYGKQQKSFKKVPVKRGLIQGSHRYFVGGTVITTKLWDSSLSLSPSIALPSSPLQAILLKPFQKKVRVLVCLHDLLSPALVAKQLGRWLVSEFSLLWKGLWVLAFNQVSAVSRVWEGSHGSVSRALSMEMGRD